MTTKRHDVFLSHSSPDKPAVEELAERLRAVGLEPFLDKWHLVPGDPWQEGLERALDESCTCAVFLGPGAMGPWQNEEMRSALEDRVRDREFRVIPVLLPGAPDPKDRPLPRFLSRLTWVDFRRGLEDEEAFRRLVCGVLGVPPEGREGRRPPRVEMRLRQIPKELEIVESARGVFGDEQADQRKAQLEQELAALERHPPIEPGRASGEGAGGGSTRAAATKALEAAADDHWETLLASYRRSLAEECAELPFGVIDARFTPGETGRPLTLDDVYVDLDVVAPSAAGEAEENAPARWALRLFRAEGGDRTAALEAVTLPEHRLAVLVGDAGSGKTTFAHHLIGLVAAGSTALSEPLAGLLPVRLVLREVAARHLPADSEEGHAGLLWAAVSDDLKRRLGEEGGRRLFPRLQARLLEGGGLFVLDGLDEVPQAHERRRVLLEAVRDLERSLAEPSRLLVTARPYAYAAPEWRLPGFATLSLAPFTPEQVRRFVDRFYSRVRTGLSASDETARSRARELAGAIADRAYLGDLASRPLLLTLMATLHASWGKLPEDRADLYGEIVRLLLGRWQRSRTLTDADGALVRVS